MADFKTHVLGAALVSGVVATGMAMVSQVSPQMIIGYFLLGVVGGILPDIDSDSSIPTRMAFTVASVLGAFMMVFYFARALSLIELVLLGLVTYAVVRHGLFTVMTQFTRHRGVIHSIPAGVFAGLLAVLIADRVFAAQITTAWTVGVFVCMGFLVHLLLDEFYSVDMRGMKVKKSFGTAFSLGTLSNPLGTAGLYLGVAALYSLCPPIHGFAYGLVNGHWQQLVWERLWPNGSWFAAVWAVVQ